MPADELEPAVAQHRSREETRLLQNLEAVANPEDQTSSRGKIHYGGHHRRKSGNGAGTKIVPIGKTARQHYEIAGVHFPLAMP